jgi:hypothetical protein
MRRPRAIITRARRNLRPIRIVARVVRVRFGLGLDTTHAHGRRTVRLRGAAGQLPELRRGKGAAPVAAVVPRSPKAAPAAHALGLLYAVVGAEMVVMAVHRGRGGGRDGR